MIGNLLGNRYEIMEQLGGGGMALVYKGRDTILNRLVTIKVLRSEYTSDDDFVKRFRSEAQAVASLSHPNIVSIYDVGRADGVDYLVMEYIEGDDLKTVIKQHAPLLPVRAAQIAMQIGEALEHAHENKIVHRDVKPQNILITRGGVAKLTDFGIALGATTATIVKSEEVMGSVHYVSPEQAKGEKTGPRSDIYSLGVVLYEMTTNALPFEGDTPVSVALKQVQEDPALPSQINPAIPLKLEKIITMAMAKNPSKRYENARQMIQELAGVTGVGSDPLRSDKEDEFATRLIPTVGGDYKNQDNSDYDELPEPARKRSYGWLWAILVLAAVIGLGAAVYHFFINVKEVSMPDVLDLTREEAEVKFEEHGITNISWNEEYTKSAPAGEIFYQYPVSGQTIKVNRPVEVTISLGIKQVIVPKVVGEDNLSANNKLIIAGLIPDSEINSQYSDQVEAGIVLDQDPKAEEEVDEGTVVTLTISKGKQPVISIMPSLTGKTFEEAQEELVAAKLSVRDDAVSRVGSVIYEAGIVTVQHPAAGVEVQEGDIVRLTVSTGPGPPAYTANVTVSITDRRPNKLEVTVSDIKGTRTALHETIDEPGILVREVQFYGDDEAVVKAFLNDYLAYIQTYKGGREVD
ncbi:MAG: Stk1 family PASTA domain-containing Ser/Thr kinase [Peptococcaceae bacterium]|nr:Stk1 family PASTA domain-containing Ser/Thr kinase [Peptococcaceae bacterium]